MFDKIKEFFSSDTDLQVTADGTATTKDIQVATAVLLLEIAGADEDFAPEEVQACFRTMETQFGIDDSDTLSLMEDAQRARESAKVDVFINAVNENFSKEQKQKVVAMLWKVILADNLVDKYEQRFVSKVRKRLELTREEADECKLMAARGEI